MGTSSAPDSGTPQKKSAVAGPWGLVGLAFVIGMAWFGDKAFDFGGDHSSPETSPETSASATAAYRATTHSSPAPSQPGDLSSCPLHTLPEQARVTVDLVVNGGPFPHPDNDGVRFGNYEGHLPQAPRSYYREYTVETPGVSHRGTRRIVTGGDPATRPEHWYYTGDHYESFCEIPDAAQR